jgi:hypothetical protein
MPYYRHGLQNNQLFSSCPIDGRQWGAYYMTNGSQQRQAKNGVKTMTSKKTLTIEEAVKAIEIAGVKVWEADADQETDTPIRIYEPGKNRYATLESGYRNATFAEYPEVKGGACSGAFCAKLRNIIASAMAV